MKLNRGVTYHTFGDKVFVHTSSQKNLILEGDAPEILHYVKENPGCTLQEICNFFIAQYDEEDALEVQIGMSEFVSSMLAENIFCEALNEPPALKTVFEEVAEYFADNNQLFSITAEITYRCVEKCIHCYIDDAPSFCSQNEMTFDDYKKILNQARKMGCVRILLTGGEVLLHKDFCDIAEYAVNLGFIVDVYTTGIGITEDIFDRLCNIGLNSVSFSLYGGDAKSHDSITGISGSFDKTLKAMLMFRSAGVEVFIKSVAIQQNFDALENLYKLANRLKIFISVSPQIQSGHTWKRAENFKLGNAELYRKFFAMDSKFRNLNLQTESAESLDKIREKRTCSAGLNSLLINPFGEVYICDGLKKSFGNVRQKNLQNIWQEANNYACQKIPKICEVTSACKTCPYVEFCHICIAEFERESKNCEICANVLVEAKAAFESYHNAL